MVLVNETSYLPFLQTALLQTLFSSPRTLHKKLHFVSYIYIMFRIATLIICFITNQVNVLHFIMAQKRFFHKSFHIIVGRFLNKVVMNINKHLLEWRELHDLKQQQVADAIGVSRSTYANYEACKRSPDIETLTKLADFYGISLDALVGHKTKQSDEASLPPLARRMLQSFDKLSKRMQERYIAHMALDVEIETVTDVPKILYDTVAEKNTKK